MKLYISNVILRSKDQIKDCPVKLCATFRLRSNNQLLEYVMFSTVKPNPYCVFISGEQLLVMELEIERVNFKMS